MVSGQSSWRALFFLLSMTPAVLAFAPHSTMRTQHTKLAASTKRRLYSFQEARKIARGHGFSNEQEFLDYDCPGAYQLPKNPQEVWSDEWRGWEDWLGIPLGFDEGRTIARQLGVTDKEAYLSLFHEKKLSDNDPASRLPYRPDLYYKDAWTSWQDWLLNA